MNKFRGIFNHILDCLLHFLQMREEKELILNKYEVPKLLLSLVRHERLFEDQEVQKKFEDIVKAVFYSPSALKPTALMFIKSLLRHARHDFNKLGIFTLYCVALGLQDKHCAQNFNIFQDDQVLTTLTLYAKDKSRSSAMANNSTMQKMIQKSDSIANSEG